MDTVSCILTATGIGFSLQKPQTHQHRSTCTPLGDTPKPNTWGPQIKELKPRLQLCLWVLRSEHATSFQQRQGLSRAGSALILHLNPKQSPKPEGRSKGEPNFRPGGMSGVTQLCPQAPWHRGARML